MSSKYIHVNIFINCYAKDFFLYLIQNLKLFSCKTREEVSHLIKGGAKVNTRHGDETTPIMIHAQRGSIDLVQELLYHHANVDLQDEVMSRAYRAAIGGERACNFLYT